MNGDQKTVAVGAASGVVLMALSVWGLYTVLPDISNVADLASRLALTLRVNVFALIPLFVMIATVGNKRFLSNAIDPLRHAEDTAMEVDGRVVDNTLQQQFVFLVSTLAISTFLDAASIKLVVALAIVYVAARIAFWIGYRMHPLYRAPGMAATSYLNLGIIVAVIYLTLS